MKHHLPFIKKVEAIEAFHLVHSDIISGRGVLLNVSQLFTEISQIGFASCEISEEIENKTRLYAITLNIQRCGPFDTEGRKLCFRLTTVSGSQFLLGCYDKPYPIVTNNQRMPSEATGKACTTVTVRLKSALPLLSILD